eukprot:TRINITY_DN2988_c0_g5_i1.p2 TRINITY_DN2988_c0_g5~~TRINITY_DN2988_c0_g5_i1.p2  ORF type:complete len:112 (-),score=5.38 TRINITY_DN2988_c0_g5_i1:23-325(-)
MAPAMPFFIREWSRGTYMERFTPHCGGGDAGGAHVPARVSADPARSDCPASGWRRCGGLRVIRGGVAADADPRWSRSRGIRARHPAPPLWLNAPLPCESQ